MYSLFVSGHEESWDGQPFLLELNRCLREYTDKDLMEQYSELTNEHINELKRYPCIFSYESGNNKDPRFGLIRDITVRGARARIEYELFDVEPFLRHEDFSKLSFELDITGWEMNRTHWALKKVDLETELSRHGIKLPFWVRKDRKSVDVAKHHFDVSFSFPGEVRDYVESVAKEVERNLGPDAYFYDNNYKAQLARPSLDILLQEIYGERSKLVVVFLCEKYEEKEWCGLEFRAIKDILKSKGFQRIMFVKMDEGKVSGVFETDGYVDGRNHSASQIAQFIMERIELANS